jgi:NhaP-type Na+/H+ or K+/H+ antiporter
MAMAKLAYKPVGLLISVAAGIAASAVVRRVWTLLTGQQDAPQATDQDHSWREVLFAAGVQGAVFGLVKAAVDRGGAAGFRKITGTWPGS